MVSSGRSGSPVYGKLSQITLSGCVQRIDSQEATSPEVTEEYFDIEARLKSKLQEKTRLLEHLQSDTAELKDILAVETELARVRTEIEQLQGRQRYRDDQVALCTVRLDVYEFPNFVPDESAATFGTRMSRAWTQSWTTFYSFVRNFTIFFVAAIPWLPLALASSFWQSAGTKRLGSLSRQLISLPGQSRCSGCVNSIGCT